MAPSTALATDISRAAPHGAPAPADDTLDMLRREAARARVDSRLDLFRACALLAPEAQRSSAAFARALLRTLGQALGRRPVFHPVGHRGALGFDEAWLLRAIERARAGDHDSLTFLVSSRIPHGYRRSVAFLVHGVAGTPTGAAAPRRAAG